MSLTTASTAFKPFKYPWAMEYALFHEQLHWGEWEVKLQSDVDQWKGNKLGAPEKNNITELFNLFTPSDQVVGNNYLEYYIPKFKNNEIRCMLTSFANREFTHQKAYALLNDTLGFDEEIYTSFLQKTYMTAKMDMMVDIDVHTVSGTALALVRSVINEGVSLFSAFAMLLSYQLDGKMRGMCEVVEWSIRDETIHTHGMIKLFREYCNEHPRIVTDEFKQSIYQMFRDAIKVEDTVIDHAFSMGDMANITAKQTKTYIRYLADRRLIQLGLKGNWKVKENPLPWVEWVVSGDSFKNFFEGTVTDYSAEGMTGDWGWT